MKKIFANLLIACLVLCIYSNLNSKQIREATLNLKGIPYNIKLDNIDYSLEELPVNQKSDIIKNTSQIVFDENWTLIDSINLNSYIHPSGYLGIKFNPKLRHMEIVGKTELHSEVQRAINKSPDWIRIDLENTLSLIPEAKQLELAEVINNANHPYIDEIAFAIANTSPNFLVSKHCFKELFTDNARLIYDNDQHLSYVDIVEHGDTLKGDYYSTVSYWKINSDGEKIKIEVPKEIYYWYIVHPKLSDEIPTFIEAKFVECDPDQRDHTWNIQSPEKGGVFWRDFLFTHTEERKDAAGEFYPVLKEFIADCQVLWDDTDQNKSAVKTITNWINDVMDFTSENERPHQPVRIYTLHIGRCGEHEDLTNSTARTCLIPCRGISTLSTDHVWNEFWDEQWEQWEPVNNSHKHKMAYSGRKYGTVFARRSDGIVEWVTKEYEKTGAVATINLTVNDNNNVPVDGAIVILFVRNLDNPNSANLDSYTITDSDGKCSFEVGTTREFFCRVISEYGNYPPTSGQVALLKSFPDSGKTYDYSCKLSGSKELIHANKINEPSDDIEDFVIEAEYQVSNQVVNWEVAFDDFDGYFSFLKKDNGKVNFYITDLDEFNFRTEKNPFDACLHELNSSNLDNYLFNFPSQSKPWVMFLDNGKNSRNFNIVDATFKLWASPTVNVDTENINNNLILHSAYPNPFSELIYIEFYINDNVQNSELKIYTIDGKLVKSFHNYQYKTGFNKIIWQGTDDNNIKLNNGVYFYKLRIGNKVLTNRINIIH